MIIYPCEQGSLIEKSQEYCELIEWTKALGIKLNPKIQYPVLFPPGYLGMQTIEEINPGEDILSAPNDSMLSMKLINTPLLQQVYSENPEFFLLPDKGHEDNRMITYFLWEQSKGIKSIWYHYINFLPKDVETIIDWTDKDLSELQDPDFEYDSIFRRERDCSGNKLLGNALKKYPDLFNEEFLTLDNMNWIWKILCTRSYGKCITYNSLIPIADLFNHRNCNTNYFYAPEDEKCPDFSNETIEYNCDDTDDPLTEKEKPLVMASLKLYKISIGYKELNDNQKEKIKEIINQARINDSQSFIQSMI